MEFTLEDISAQEFERRRELFGPLADSVRELIDAVIRTEVDEDIVHDAHAQIVSVVESLRTRQIEGSFGVRHTADMKGMPWGNAVIGLRNAVAPPLQLTRQDNGLVTTDFTLGAAYEGPPGCVHGGVCAMVLDHVLGQAGSADDVPCYTGTLTMRYLRPTPLGRLHAEAIIAERDGRKKIVRGAISDAHGETVTAEGVFIVPKDWAGVMPETPRPPAR
ncbi:PaaI family thioesterase [Gordonia hankookensis]|uniref:PaaI family thioesterase n=1 Tax=Gordonia hankookensis TaxID=589403 RepID=A0ABR7W7U4_9ACTN|nr:PaaI family thioesterase [Gordonia hankookensis]MBD1318895.1 PaaI family thioesterase [Gordonia hankookensis]